MSKTSKFDQANIEISKLCRKPPNYVENYVENLQNLVPVSHMCAHKTAHKIVLKLELQAAALGARIAHVVVN